METTGKLSNEMMIFLIATFLERSQANIIHAEGAKIRKHPKNSGKTMTWNRYDPLAVATTALTEAVNPNANSLNSDTVTATLHEYGDHVKISSLLSGTSIDKQSQEKTEVMAQQAAETIDTLVRDELFAGATTQFANGRANLNAVTDADVFGATEVRKAVRTLKKNNAISFEDGYFLGKVGPDTAFDLMGDPVWVNAHTYKDGKELYKGEIGKLHKARFLEASSNQKSEMNTASTPVEVFSNFIHGKEAIGTVDLEGTRSGKNIGLIIKNPDKGDTSNPLNMFMTIGWKATFATKILNPDWIINIKSGASK